MKRQTSVTGAMQVNVGDWRPSTDTELDAAAVITPADLEHAMQTAREISPELAQMLEVRPMNPKRSRSARRNTG